MSRAISQSSHREPWSLDDVQHIVLDNVSWELYEHLLKEIGNRPIRLTYDHGDLEIMSPLPEHEASKKAIARMIETLAEELDLPIAALGSTTFRRKLKQRGLEPDECYYVRNYRAVRGKRRISLPRDPPPDLAVEIDITTRSVERLPIYAALGVPEVWRYDGRQVHCLLLGDDGEYRASGTSLAFPMLHPAELTQFIRVARLQDYTTAAKTFRRWVRKQGWVK